MTCQCWHSLGYMTCKKWTNSSSLLSNGKIGGRFSIVDASMMPRPIILCLEYLPSYLDQWFSNSAGYRVAWQQLFKIPQLYWIRVSKWSRNLSFKISPKWFGCHQSIDSMLGTTELEHRIYFWSFAHSHMNGRMICSQDGHDIWALPSPKRLGCPDPYAHASDRTRILSILHSSSDQFQVRIFFGLHAQMQFVVLSSTSDYVQCGSTVLNS